MSRFAPFLLPLDVAGIAAALAAAGIAAAPRPLPSAPPAIRAGHPPATAASAPSRFAAPEAFLERAGRRGWSVPKRVLALYYPWYGTPQRSGKWLHQEGVELARKSIASHTHFPAIGPYDSTDPAVIDLHLRQAQAAGIETLVCSWWGRDDPTDQAIRLLLARAPTRGVSVCIYWERLSGPRDPSAAIGDLAYLLQTFGKQPGYLKEDGRPVVFLYARTCQSLLPNDWAAVLNEVHRRYPPGLLAIGEGSSQTDLLLWDGLHTLGHTYQMAGLTLEAAARVQHETFRAPILLGRRLGRVSIVTVAPGLDDRKPNISAGLQGGAVIDRQDGKLYTALWEQAIRDQPHWILINSFNQWHTGTEIEPSVELGDRYLALTREFARRFKQGSPASQPEAGRGPRRSGR